MQLDSRTPGPKEGERDPHSWVGRKVGGAGAPGGEAWAGSPGLRMLGMGTRGVGAPQVQNGLGTDSGV